MKIIPFTKEDYSNLYHFALPIWLETYKNIIPKAQIEFLVNKYFDSKRINYYIDLGYQYYNLVDKERIGFLVIVDRTNEIYLDKIYFNSNSQGKGYFKEVVDFLISFNKPIKLNVNQKNDHAIKAYLKNGFIIEKEEVIILQDDMINIDYVMKKDVK